MSDEEILFSDYKEYEIEGYKVGIGNVFSSDELGDRQANVTHIPFCGNGAREAAEAGFGTSATPDDCIVTTYISSRKAQFLPAITEGIRQTK